MHRVKSVLNLGFIIFQYRCFVENCTEIFPNSKTRKNHCISAHQFPKGFAIWQVKVKKSFYQRRGQKSYGSVLHNNNKGEIRKKDAGVKSNNPENLPKQTTETKCESMDCVEMDIDKAEKKVREKAANKLQPHSTQPMTLISFGHSARRFKPRFHFGLPNNSHRCTTTTIDMKEVSNALKSENTQEG